jgi:single-stranded-DNA-specific exonuclease
LRACDDLLVRHGGHAMAAGLTVNPANIIPLRERLNRLARQCLTREQLQPSLRLDAEVPLASLNRAQVEDLERLQPTGQGNPVVQVVVRNLVNHRAPQRMGKDGHHVKFRVTEGRTVTEAVWWRAGDAEWPTGRFDLAVVPQLNNYNGQRSVQLRILDWQPTTAHGVSAV